MTQTRQIGALRLEMIDYLASQLALSDFCAPAATLEFRTDSASLATSGMLFKLSYPGYELECSVHNGMVFIRRNDAYQHSESTTSPGRVHVAVQWDTDSVACGVMPEPWSSPEMGRHMRAAKTPFTLPPLDLVRLLRSNALLPNAVHESADSLFGTVLDCIHLAEQDIRRHGGERFIWGKGGNPTRPFDEPEISRFVAGYLSSHGAARNFDVSCESVAGNGSLDFYVIAPTTTGLARVAIEAKKADHANLAQGLSRQLPTYMQRIGTRHGIFLTYWLKSTNYPHPSHDRYQDLEISILRPVARPPTVRTVCIDLSNGPTPSAL